MAFPDDDAPVEVARVITDEGERDVGYRRIGELVVIEGDMVFAAADFDAARVDLGKGRSDAAVRTLSTSRWPNGIVPFVIDPALPDPGRVTSAIAHWEARTPFRFVARTSESSFVRFVDGGGCWSYVGRQGGAQQLSLASGCSTGNAIHEIGHAIGFWHEQSRADRDMFVTIQWGCIQSGQSSNFARYTDAGNDGVDVGPYDFGSIMHYGASAFSNGCNTITPKLPNANIGQRGGLSAGDILAAHRVRYGARPGLTTYAADHDGDGRADLGLKDDTGTWRIDYAVNGFGTWDLTRSGYGAADAVPVPADYDGDGKADLAIKSHAGGWYIDHAVDGFGAWNVVLQGYGDATVVPVPADYDGDGKADLSVKDKNGYWHIDHAAGGFGAWNVIVGGYGDATVVPVPADYDGDGKADLSVKDRYGYWHIDYAAGGFGAWNAILGGYGDATVFPAPADYDGDGKADLSVKDRLGYWHIDYAAGGFGAWNAIVSGYGGSASKPLPEDYDGDGRADLSVKESDGAGVFYIDHASNGFVGWNYVLPLGV